MEACGSWDSGPRENLIWFPFLSAKADLSSWFFCLTKLLWLPSECLSDASSWPTLLPSVLDICCSLRWARQPCCEEPQHVHLFSLFGTEEHLGAQLYLFCHLDNWNATGNRFWLCFLAPVSCLGKYHLIPIRKCRLAERPASEVGEEGVYLLCAQPALWRTKK